jgi:two-component system NtrC family sensor kinase
MDAVAKNGGTITLTTRYDAVAHQIVFECNDTGPGIAAKIRGDIFKPFFTTKPVGKGTGLGLYICHEIVQKHGGTLHLSENNPSGALFTVRLPAPVFDTRELE